VEGAGADEQDVVGVDVAVAGAHSGACVCCVCVWVGVEGGGTAGCWDTLQSMGSCLADASAVLEQGAALRGQR
jgi:hypothetical protein